MERQGNLEEAHFPTSKLTTNSKTVRSWHEDRHRDQQIKIQNRTHTFMVNQCFDQGHSVGKVQPAVLVQMDIHVHKNEAGL